MRPFETADVALIETLKARHETLKAQLAAAERQDAQNAAEIAAELREIAGKASAELFRVVDRLAALAEERSRPWWRRLSASLGGRGLRPEMSPISRTTLLAACRT